MSDESRIEKQLKKMNATINGSGEVIETEEPQSRIEKLLEEINGNLGKSSGGGVKPDWSVDDEKTDGYIANKPAIRVGGGKKSIVEGVDENRANGDFSHCEGDRCKAYGESSHAEGLQTLSGNYYCHAEGCGSEATGHNSHSEGYQSKATGLVSHAEGCLCVASGSHSHAEGEFTMASGNESHVEGYNTIASGNQSHVSGKYNVEDTENKYAEIVGNGTDTSQKKRSNARTLDWEGNEWLAGKLTVGTDPADDMDVATKKYVDGKATGAGAAPDWSAEESAAGYIANKPAIKAGTGSNSIIQNQGSEANGNNSHAEGFNSHAIGKGSHAEGMETIAQAVYSHAEGYNTKASGYCSHSEGRCTIAGSEYSHVIGKYNVEDKYNFFVEIVGNGTGTMESTRSNARTLDWSGNEKLAGKLTVGAAPAEDMDVTTKKYVDDLIAELQKKIDALTPA